MATYSQYLTAGALVDDKFKSTVAAPIAQSLDLEGCGVRNYIKASNSANFNTRLGCGPVNPLASFTHSATWYNPTAAAQVILPAFWNDYLQEYLSGLDFGLDEIANNAVSTTPSEVPDLLFGTPDWDRVGSNYIAISGGDPVTGLRAGSVSLSEPRVKIIRECGRAIGVKVASSISYTVVDPLICTSRLGASVSLSYTRYEMDKLGRPITFVNTPSFETAFGATRVMPSVLYAHLNGKAKETIGNFAFSAWSALDLAGTTYAVGSFS